MKISTITTLTDWTSLAGCWGKPGVYRMLELIHIAGIRDVYWRVYNGGMAMYPSRVAQVQDREAYDEWQRQKAYPQPTLRAGFLKECDFNAYDPIPDALEAARELGINLHLWYTLFEDDHGGPWLCRFAKDHPEYWQMDREGRAYRGTLDFFFEAVRAYKLAIVDELLAYGAAGLLLDFARHNACPSADPHGVHRFGYNPEIRNRYRETEATDPLHLPPDDPGWLDFKRAYMTSFLHEIRRRMDATQTCRELSMMIWPVDYARWACIDIPRLTGDRTVQMLNAFSLAYTYHPREIVKQHEIMQKQAEGTDCRLLPGIMCYNGIYPANVDACVEAAADRGIEELMLYEANALVEYNLLTTVRAVNTGVPAYTRTLTATRVDAADVAAVDWSAIPEHTAFLFNSGPKDDPVPSEKTSLQIAYGDESVLFKFTCRDSHMAEATAPVPDDPRVQYYLDALGSRTHIIYTHGINLFLDAKQSHQDFHHFYVSPRHDRLQETMADERWIGPWDSSVEAEEDQWTALFRIPYSTLGVDPPRPGDEWGINVLRGIRHAAETNAWFLLRWTQPYPDDMGHLRFE